VRGVGVRVAEDEEDGLSDAGSHTSNRQMSRMNQLQDVLDMGGGLGIVGTRDRQAALRVEPSIDGHRTQDLVNRVAGKPMEEFAGRRFNFNRKGMFNSRTTMTKILSFKTDLLSKPLLTFENRQEEAMAVQAFRNITGFMGDRSTGKSPFDHLIKILNNCMSASELLRDEVYCQVVKQTTHNPSNESTARGWQLLTCLLACFPPSADLSMHLANYIAANLGSLQPHVARFSEHCLHRVFRICELGTRKEMPTAPEIAGMMRCMKTNVRVFIVSTRKYLNVPVESWTTAGELARMLATQLGIRDPRPFRLFDMSVTSSGDGTDEKLLAPSQRVLDLISLWNRKEEEECHGKSKNYVPRNQRRLVYRVHLYLEVQETDTAALQLMFEQAKSDVLVARYPCTERDAITLAALQLQEQLGDYPQDRLPEQLRGKLDRYLARKFVEGASEDARQRQIHGLWVKLQGYTRLDCQLSYLDYCHSWKLFGSRFFFTSPLRNSALPREVPQGRARSLSCPLLSKNPWPPPPPRRRWCWRSMPRACSW